MNTKVKKGLSLLELLVVMAVLAVLSIVAIIQILILQRNARDKNRVSNAKEILDIVNEYRRDNLRYPSSKEVVFETDRVLVGDIEISLESYYKAANQTDSNSTRYFYSSENGLMFCIKLESGKIESLGNRSCVSEDQWSLI